MSLQQAVGNFRIASKINCGVVSPAEVCIKTDSTCCWCHAVYLYSLHLLLWSLSPGGNPTKNKTGKNTVWYRITPETKNIQPASRTTSFSLDWYDGMAFLLLLFFFVMPPPSLLWAKYHLSTARWKQTHWLKPPVKPPDLAVTKSSYTPLSALTVTFTK